jgi:hypothetical protein
MQLYNADATMFFLAPESMKKPPSKVVHNRDNFLFQYGQKREILYHQKPLNAGLGI